MASDQDTSFARLVSLACHDLRTPLATVSGFAKTLTRLGEVDDRIARYLGMIDAASEELAALLDELSLAARIESGRYEPALQPVDTLELARSAADRVDAGEVVVDGDGTGAELDVDAAERSLAAFAQCILRHGQLQRLDLTVAGLEITFAPVPPAAAAVVLGEKLRDFGAAVARRHVEWMGGSVAVTAETLVVWLGARAE
jgi:signal transduction histidine kinase